MPASVNRGKVLVTPRSLTARDLASNIELALLTEAGFELVSGPAGRYPTEEELFDLATPCVGWLAGVEPISARVLEAAPQLRVISRNGVGVDNIDLDAAQRCGVRVVPALGANARGVAELTVGLTLAALRHIPRSDRALRGGEWRRWEGRELANCTVGVVGYGTIGRIVAGLLRALGATVVASDPLLPSGTPAEVPLVGLTDLLAAADVVSLHVPAQPGSAPLLGAPQFALMRPGAVVVNTARASLVDEAAALDALDAGQLRCYAVDVFDSEPPAPSALHQHDGVILTPHIGGFTVESVQRATRTAVENLLDALTPQAATP
jgi:phosphoglycerate dehydrogenase-like enzyme